MPTHFKFTPRFICWRVDLGKNYPAYVTRARSTDGKQPWAYTERKAAARTLGPELVKEFETDVSREGGIAFCKSTQEMSKPLLGRKRIKSRKVRSL